MHAEGTGRGAFADTVVSVEGPMLLLSNEHRCVFSRVLIVCRNRTNLETQDARDHPHARVRLSVPLGRGTRDPDFVVVFFPTFAFAFVVAFVVVIVIAFVLALVVIPSTRDLAFVFAWVFVVATVSGFLRCCAVFVLFVQVEIPSSTPPALQAMLCSRRMP